MDDRLDNVVVQSPRSSAQISNVAFLGKGEAAQMVSAISGKGCGSADCNCYGDNGCADVDNGGGDSG